MEIRVMWLCFAAGLLAVVPGGCSNSETAAGDSGVFTDADAEVEEDTDDQGDIDDVVDAGLDAGNDAGVDDDAGVDNDSEADMDAGDSDPSSLLSCVQVCTPGGYCVPPGECDGSRCITPESALVACGTDNDCVPVGSFWDGGTDCQTSEADCSHSAFTGDLLEACIEIDGAGYCVRIPQHDTDCENRNAKDIEWQDIEGNPVTVCGRTSYICENEFCVPGCDVDADCSSSLRPKCDIEQRHCVCTEASCGVANDGRVCMPAGSCGCNEDADCPGPGFDQCYQGLCGCSDTASCQELLPGLNTVCEVSP